MSKYNPGEWSTSNSGNGAIAITAPIPGHENTATSIAWVKLGSTGEANAQLISAAPNLLTALKAILSAYAQPISELYNADGTPNALWGTIDHAHKLAYAAIVKAEDKP